MPNFATYTWNALAGVTASLFNTYIKDNLEAIRRPERVWNNISSTTNLTTSATSFTNVGSDFLLVLTPNIASGLTCDIEIGATFTARPSTTVTTYGLQFDLTVNGTSVSGGRGVAGVQGNSVSSSPFTILWRLSDQDNSAKTIRLQWRVNNAAAVATLVHGTAAIDGSQPQFWARVCG